MSVLEVALDPTTAEQDHEYVQYAVTLNYSSVTLYGVYSKTFYINPKDFYLTYLKKYRSLSLNWLTCVHPHGRIPQITPERW